MNLSHHTPAEGTTQVRNREERKESLMRNILFQFADRFAEMENLTASHTQVFKDGTAGGNRNANVVLQKV